MPTKNKTAETAVSVVDFINSWVEKEEKRQDSFRLIELMRKWSGHEPRMWGPSIVGFGSVHYKYASGREGDNMIAGFSPRKQHLVLYLGPGLENKPLRAKLGKHKATKGCLYINKLDDIDRDVLRELVTFSVAEMKRITA